MVKVTVNSDGSLVPENLGIQLIVLEMKTSICYRGQYFIFFVKWFNWIWRF
jgi:hypothetical protein